MNRAEAFEWLDSLSWSNVSAEEFATLPPREQYRRIRHSAAHVMADAVSRLHPDAQFAIGPATDDGFFYDIHLDEPLDEQSVERIQQMLDEVVSEKHAFRVTRVSREDAAKLFQAMGQSYKLAILDRIADPTVTLYRHGNFIDLCAGPHAPSTDFCRHARVLGFSAAHWRGETNPSLTRLRGTAWRTHDELKAYLRFVQEARARDHRVLGPQLGLFSFHEWAASALWHPDGLVVRRELADFWRELMDEHGYIEILNPVLYKKELFETSGHWEHFRDNMFLFEEGGEVSWVLKPMNCPDTMLFFQTQVRSYRELPLRVAESQVLHRNERSGTIQGIMRTRNFVQDDAHIFLSEEHVEGEMDALLGLVDRIYSMLGLQYDLTLSTRPESFMGDPAVWDQAEADLRSALEKVGRGYAVDEGGGAFYGPKIDVHIRDSLGRRWQCGTVQLDFQLPLRFDLHYTAADGSRRRPIVIHRAIFGSFERFIGVLIEHFAARFPTWLAPVQAVVLPIGEAHVEHARKVHDRLRREGFRVRMETEGSLNARVRAAEKRRASYVLVAGDREVADGAVSVRRHGEQGNRVLDIDALVRELRDKVADRVLDVDLESIRLAPIPGVDAGVVGEDGY